MALSDFLPQQREKKCYFKTTIMQHKQLIHKYARNELSAQELEQFQQLCASDKDFAEEAELAAFLYAQKKVAQKKHWQGMLKNKSSSTIENAPSAKIKQLKPKPTSWAIWRIAAVFALVTLSMTIFWFLNQGSNLNQIVATEIGSPYPAPVLTMDKTEANTWLTASRAYREGRFETMVMILEDMRTENTLTAEQHFYLGLSYLYVQPCDAQAALSHFEKSERIGIPTLKAQLKWFKSLAFLELDEKEKAKILLEEIVQANSWKKDKAAELLERL